MTGPTPGDVVQLTVGPHEDHGTVIKTGTDPYGNPYAVVDLPTRRVGVGVDMLEVIERKSIR